MTNKKLLVFMADGLGISLSWPGNALACANPTNFYSLWNSFPHFLLSHNPENIELFKAQSSQTLEVLSNGEITDFSKIIDEAITCKEFFQNQVLIRFFSEIAKHGSGLHLIGNLSRNGEFGKMNHLFSLIKMARANGIFKIYLHLIVDESFDDIQLLKDKLCLLTEELEKDNIAHIGTVAGNKCLLDNKGLVLLSRNIAFSAFAKKTIESAWDVSEQAPSLLNPVKFCEKGISDFDGLLFFNHASQSISSLIEIFLSNKSLLFEKEPPVFSSLSLADFPSRRKDKLSSVFEKPGLTRLGAYLSNQNKKVVLISQEECLLSFRYYLLGSSSDVFAKSLKVDEAEDLRGVISKSLGEADCVFVKWSKIAQAQKINLRETIGAIRDFDRILPSLFENEQNDILGLLLSAFGGSESMNAVTSAKESSYENRETFTSLPLVLVSSNHKRPLIFDQRQIFLEDILKINRDFSFSGEVLRACLKEI